MRTEEEKLHLLVAIDRTTKFSHAKLYKQVTKDNALNFLKDTIKAFPYPIQTILTDNGIQFTNRKTDKMLLEHVFSRYCKSYKIIHKTTQVNHPFTNGQGERMNRTIKEMTVKKCYYKDFDSLNRYLSSFMGMYNYVIYVSPFHVYPS